MNLAARSICALILFFTFLQHPSAAQGQNSDITFEQLKKEFADPSKEYRSAPLWVWHYRVTKPEIDRMLTELRESGFGGAFVHPRPGLITEYLSDEWFELFKYSVDKGKQLGLDIWIYDENSYPSGFAGGHVPAQMPESFNQGQGLAPEKFATVPDNYKDYYLCLKKEGDGFIDITGKAGDYRNRPGDYYLFRKTFYAVADWNAGYSYVDVLAKGVTDKFMDVTMSGYEKSLGNELGPIVKGVFTDEPNIASPGGVRWTPDLFDVFRETWGYDLKTCLPSLVEETGNWKEIRHNYLETMLQLFVDRWAKPWYEYCERKGLQWTGHYWEHGWPDVGHGPDNMAMYAWHQMPAIDMLFNQFDERNPQAQFGNVRSVKELRSVANQMGYQRTLSETYGGAGWDVTFQDLKRLGDWEYVLGVNFMNQHLTHATLTGARKYDYPPYFTYHSPWWSHYKVLNDYYGRLSYLLSQGEQYNDVLVIEPTTTVWLYYAYTGSGPKVMEIGGNFQDFVTRLEKAQVEYDLGCENIIKDRGSVKGGLFTIGQRGYKTVVIPPMTENLNKETLALLKQFTAAGGKVVTFSLPVRVDGKLNKEITDFVRFDRKIDFYPELCDSAMDVLRNGTISFTDTKGAGLYHQRREYGDGQLLFLVNSSLNEAASGNVTLDGAGVMELDAMTPEIYSYPSTVSGGKMTARFDLPPAGSLLLYVSNTPVKGYKARNVTVKNNIVPSEGAVKGRRVRDNVLTVDFLDLTLNGTQYKDMYFADAARKYFVEAGFPNGDPWMTAVQYKTKIVDRDTMTTGKATASYRFRVSAGADKKSMKLAVEQPELWTSVKVNGKSVTPKKGEWFLDKSFGVYHIGDIVKDGENVVEVTIEPFSVFAEFEPVYITGDFDVAMDGDNWKIVKAGADIAPGSWKAQGAPFYAWDVAYAKDYRITDTSAAYAVRLPDWNGTVAEVLVNGKSAGIIAFQPYELDITSFLKKGNNKVEVRVTGSNKNLLGPFHNVRDVGINHPGQWMTASGPAKAADYNQFDYGLVSDFQLVSNK